MQELSLIEVDLVSGGSRINRIKRALIWVRDTLGEWAFIKAVEAAIEAEKNVERGAPDLERVDPMGNSY
jgi:hypothetical protein